MIGAMKNNQTSVLIIFLMLGTMMCFFLGKAVAKDIEVEDHLLKVICRNKPNGLSPSSVTVKPGETVVWYNNDPAPIQIKFMTKGMLATKVPVNFYGSGSGRYESNMIPQGGTASLCFMRVGKYVYEVVGSIIDEKGDKNELLLEGKVIVER